MAWKILDLRKSKIFPMSQNGFMRHLNHRIDEHFLRVLPIAPYFLSHIVALARDFETLSVSTLSSKIRVNPNLSVQNYRKLPDTLRYNNISRKEL